MTEANSKSQGGESWVAGGEKKNYYYYIKWLCIVQGSNTGRTE